MKSQWRETDVLGNNESLVQARNHSTDPEGRSQNSGTVLKLIHVLYSILLVAKGQLWDLQQSTTTKYMGKFFNDIS